MPTYDYRCNGCGHRFDAFQSIKAGALKKCPECGKNTLERLIGTGGAVLFKGSGFYQTDYRSKEYTEAAKKESGAGSDSASGSGSGSSSGSSSGSGEPGAGGAETKGAGGGRGGEKGAGAAGKTPDAGKKAS